MTVSVVFAIAGVLALLFGVIGGGIKAKEIEVPRLPVAVRIVTIIAGLTLLGATLWLENKDKVTLAIDRPAQPSALPQNTEIPPTVVANTQTPTATMQTEKCVNAAQFKSETIPDGTVLKPGEKFTKTWTIKNIGSCTWEPEYRWVFVDGNMIGASAPAISIKSTIAPGQAISISLDLTAPLLAGSYRGDWMLQDLSGINFGVINNKDSSYTVPFWVLIEVRN